MSKKMKAALLYGPEQEFRIEEVDRPEHQQDSAIVKVRAAGVCGTELDFVEGIFPVSPSPMILGHEIAGDITEVDPGKGFSRGDRVAVYNMMACGSCRYCRKGLESLCTNPKGQLGFNASGGFAEYTRVPISSLVHLPDEVDYPSGAVLGCSGLSAMHATRIAGIGLGETVVVNGVGGVGVMIVQVASLTGAKVIGVVDSEWRAGMAKEAGADEVIIIDPAKYSELPQRVRELTEGGADIFFELVGTTQTIKAGLDSLRGRGRFLVIGYTDENLEYNPVNLLKREIQIRSSVAGSKVDLEDALQYAARKKIKTYIDSVRPLDDINICIKLIQERKVRGRNVLRME